MPMGSLSLVMVGPVDWTREVVLRRVQLDRVGFASQAEASGTISPHAGVDFPWVFCKTSNAGGSPHTLVLEMQMQVEAVNPETGERFALELSPEELEELVRDARPRLSKKALERKVDNLAIPADVKVSLASFTSATVKIGNAVLNIGRRVLEIVLDLVKRYPKFTFAVVLYLVGKLLVTVVPALIPMLGPLLPAMELAFAFVMDYLERRKKDAAWKGEQADNPPLAKDYLESLEKEPIWREVQEAIRPFEALKAAA